MPCVSTLSTFELVPFQSADGSSQKNGRRTRAGLVIFDPNLSRYLELAQGQTSPDPRICRIWGFTQAVESTGSHRTMPGAEIARRHLSWYVVMRRAHKIVVHNDQFKASRFRRACAKRPSVQATVPVFLKGRSRAKREVPRNPRMSARCPEAVAGHLLYKAVHCKPHTGI
jgi:hypothetical protein